MSIIKVSCIDQVLTMTNTPVIASGGVQEDQVTFSFCPLWEGYYKTAVFWRNEAEAYHVVLDDTYTCTVPREVLVADGPMFFGVFGVNDAGVQRTSEVLRYNIVKGAITEGTKPSDPTPDIYTQLLSKIAAMGDNKGKADKVSSATEGNFAGLDAEGNLTDSGVKALDFIPITGKGVAGGVASLDEAGKVLADQLPSMDYAAKNHASQHAVGGSDPITPEDIGAGRVNPNLLDNWYFGNPVNQRGNTTYGNIPQYCIDRWRINNDYAFVDVNGGYITIRGNDINGYGGIIQYLEASLKAGLVGKTVTLSALMKPYTAMKVAGKQICAGAEDAFNLYSFTFAWTVESDSMLSAAAPVTPGEPIADVLAIKLELGPQQTLAHQDADGNWVLNEIPNYNEQLLRCTQSTADSSDTYANKVVATLGADGKLPASQIPSLDHLKMTKVAVSDVEFTGITKQTVSIGSIAGAKGLKIRMYNTTRGAVSSEIKNNCGTLSLYNGSTAYVLLTLNVASAGNIFADIDVDFIYPNTDGATAPIGYAYKSAGLNADDVNDDSVYCGVNPYVEADKMSAIDRVYIKFSNSALSYPFTCRVEVWRVDYE